MNRRVVSFGVPALPRENANDVPDTRRRLFDSLILRRQYLHVTIMSLLPFIGTIIAVAVALRYGLVGIELPICFGMWLVAFGIGGTIGLHRYFTHRSFETFSPIRVFIAVCSSFCCQGSILAWVATHRRHHECSDQFGDPHSPHLQGSSFADKIVGLWHAHCGWLIGHEFADPVRYAPDCLRDPTVMWASRNYYSIAFLGALIPAVIGYSATVTLWGFVLGLLWGGAVRVFVSNQLIWSINSVCHFFGFRSYETSEHSTNNIILAIPTLGEAWHNNHHAFPSSAKFSTQWWQIDLAFVAISAMECVGLVWNVKRPEIIRS